MNYLGSISPLQSKSIANARQLRLGSGKNAARRLTKEKLVVLFLPFVGRRRADSNRRCEFTNIYGTFEEAFRVVLHIKIFFILLFSLLFNKIHSFSSFFLRRPTCKFFSISEDQCIVPRNFISCHHDRVQTKASLGLSNRELNGNGLWKRMNSTSSFIRRETHDESNVHISNHTDIRPRINEQ